MTMKKNRVVGRATRARPPKPTEPSAPTRESKVFAYCRVSTLRQSDEGESLEAQRRQIDGYAAMHGMAVARVFVETGVSGSKPLAERPEGAALLTELQPGDVVITTKLDRLFRSALDALDRLAWFKQRGISLHMLDLGGDVTANGISKLVFAILSAVAEGERDWIRERVAEVKKDQRARHRYLGGKAPFGFRVGEGGALVEVPTEQAAIRRMRKLRDGGASFAAIAGKVSTGGITITAMGVLKVLRREAEHAAS